MLGPKKEFLISGHALYWHGYGKPCITGSGFRARSKKFKMPFFQDIKNSFHWVTRMGRKPHQSFFKNFFNKYGRQRSSKFLLTRGRYWPTDEAMTKIFLSIYPKHIMRKCWKLQVNILRDLDLLQFDWKILAVARPLL